MQISAVLARYRTPSVTQRVTDDVGENSRHMQGVRRRDTGADWCRAGHVPLGPRATPEPDPSPPGHAWSSPPGVGDCWPGGLVSWSWGWGGGGGGGGRGVIGGEGRGRGGSVILIE